MNAGRDMNEASIRPATTGDFFAVVDLLTRCGLSAGDLAAAHLRSFFVAVTGDRLIGVAGVELLDGVGLLRSLAVEPEFRHHGLAQRLVEACEALATGERGISTWYLLTTTAADYFQRRGYDAIPRDTVPAGIAAHPQFLGLCPASARCLRKSLADRAPT